MLQRIAHPNGVVTYRSPLIDRLGVPHGFTTRIGGASPAPFNTLDLGPGSPTDLRRENLRRVCKALNLRGTDPILVSQVHGCGVCIASPGASPAASTEADAIVSDTPGNPLLIRTADCVPILLAGPGGRVVAAVHAGWRGMIAHVIDRTLDRMTEHFGIDAAEVTAAVGPCIGVRHFEVGEEVAAAFVNAGLEGAIDRHRGTRAHVNLSAAVAMQLTRRGVKPQRIDTTDRCTFEDAAEFFSHRRDAGRTGRMAAVIAARPSA